jgi:LCP family protein required for cell wall assembly
VGCRPRRPGGRCLDRWRRQQLPPTLGEIEGGVNMLVVGTDSCEGPNAALSGACENHDTEGERNDVTMLVHISDAAPRDGRVVPARHDRADPSCTGPDGTQYSAMSGQMLNASYMYGGLSCTVATIEKLTGIDIQFAAATRWTGVIAMSDAIGGSTSASRTTSATATPGSTSQGHAHAAGREALQFLRIRHGIGDGSDLGRISNQQQFLSSLVRKLQSGGRAGQPRDAVQPRQHRDLAGDRRSAAGRAQQDAREPAADGADRDGRAERALPGHRLRAVPHGVRDRRSRVDPVTSAAKVLFDALANNQPIQLTGSTSDGYGTEVVGEATPRPPIRAPPPARRPPATRGRPPRRRRRRRRSCSCRRPSLGRPRPRSPAPSPSADRAVNRMPRHPVRQGGANPL